MWRVESRTLETQDPTDAPLISTTIMFNEIPYELKRIIVRSSSLGPIDILWLSHVSRLWRETCIEDDIFLPWYNILDLDARETLENVQGIENIPKRCAYFGTTYLQGDLTRFFSSWFFSFSAFFCCPFVTEPW